LIDKDSYVEIDICVQICCFLLRKPVPFYDRRNASWLSQTEYRSIEINRSRERERERERER